MEGNLGEVKSLVQLTLNLISTINGGGNEKLWEFFFSPFFFFAYYLDLAKTCRRLGDKAE